LAAILEDHFGIKVDKRWQRYNWGNRPLDRAALVYAGADTHYLLAVREMQLAQLSAAGRGEEAREIFAQVSQVEAASSAFDPSNFWRVKGVWDLGGREQAIVQELHAYRDTEARQCDKPPFRILGDQTLIALAQTQPDSLEDLRRASGMTAWQINRYGRGILAAVARGRKAKIPRPPYSPRPDDSILTLYEALRAWRNNVAHQRGVEPDVIMSNAALMDIAQRRPATLAELEGIEGLGPWRRKTYGAELLRIIYKT
jgi:ribonuclease D